MNRTPPPSGALLTTLLLAISLGCGDGGGNPSDAGTDGAADVGADAAPCPTTGTGTITVNVNGLPASAGTPVKVAGGGGAHDLGASQSLTLPAGPYTVTAARVTTPDPIVRTVYTATISAGTTCVADGQTQTVTVTYAAVPTSNKLWTPNGTGGNGNLLGFASANLAASGSPAASVVTTGPAGVAVAFDLDGNLWSFGPTTADAMLNRFPAASMAASGTVTPDRAINLAGVGCVPATGGAAFDASGNLWISSPCQKAVVRLAADQLAASGDVTPAVTLSGLTTPTGVALDKGGNLWVADGDAARLRRYDAAHLSAPAAAADLSLEPQNATPADVPPTALAFDASGNLWALDFGGSEIYEIAAADLSGTGDKVVAAKVVVSVVVSAVPAGFAFDEGGGLWVAYTAGKLARFSPSQLTVSSGSGNPTTPDTIVTSADIGYAADVAFYPAPAALPLFDALP